MAVFKRVLCRQRLRRVPPAFSWLTFGQVPLGSAPSAVRLSEVAGVASAGTEFMRTVFCHFALHPDQVLGQEHVLSSGKEGDEVGGLEDKADLFPT